MALLVLESTAVADEDSKGPPLIPLLLALFLLSSCVLLLMLLLLIVSSPVLARPRIRLLFRLRCRSILEDV